MVEVYRLQLAREYLEQMFRVKLRFSNDQLIFARFKGGNAEIEYEYEKDIGLEMLRITITFDYTVVFNIWDIQWIDHFFDFLQRLMDDAIVVTEEVEVTR